jgi:uncharacterized membrane protein
VKPNGSVTVPVPETYWPVSTSANPGSTALNAPPALTPEATLQGVLSDLVALQAAYTEKKGRKNLETAMKDLTESSQTGFWLSSSQLDSAKGKAVFESFRHAVSQLDAIKSKAAGSTIQALINRIVQLARTLAEEAILGAAAQGATTKQLAKANNALALGGKDAAAGKISQAIRDYQDAWSLAQ